MKGRRDPDLPEAHRALARRRSSNLNMPVIGGADEA